VIARRGARWLGAAIGVALALPGTAAAVAITPGQIFATDAGAGPATARVVAVDPLTGEQTLVSDNAISEADLFARVDGIALDAGMSLLVTDSQVARLIRVDPASGQQTLVSDSSATPNYFDTPTDVVVEPSGSLLVADAKSNALIRVDPATGAQTLVSDNTVSALDLFVDPTFVVLDGTGRALVADPSAGAGAGGAIIAVDLATGQQALLSDNATPAAGLFDGLGGIAREYGGRLLAANGDGAAELVGIDPVTGGQTTVSPGPGLLGGPQGLAVDPAGAVVADWGALPPDDGSLVRIDPVTGAQTTLSNNALSATDLLAHPNDVAIVPPQCSGRFATIVADAGPNPIAGTAGDDVIFAGSGNDQVDAGGGADLICGGEGNDGIRGGAGKDKLLGEAGRDKLFGGGGRDVLKGAAGRDKLKGGGGRDKLRGGPGKDRERQ
jgi:Ca2+-binding RTX toxin-like protein